MKRASRFLLCLALCALLCAALAMSAGAVEAAGENHWVIDYNDSANTTFPDALGSSGWYYVWLFPGDTVEFVAPTNRTAGTGGHNNGYTIGAQLYMNNTYLTSGVSGHLEVQTITLGTPTADDRSNVFITKVTCVGTQPVFFYNSGSCGASSDTGIVYYGTTWGYAVADASLTVKYVYKDTSGNVIDTDTCKLYNAPTLTSVAAADGQSRTQCPGTSKSVTLSTPCIEGYQFKSWSVSCANTAGKSVYQTYLNNNTLTWELCNSVDKNAGATYGSGAVITLTATFYPSWYTLTLDANGGTIDGAASMGYEAKTSSTFSFALSDKTPVRAGYTFAGWYTDTTYTTKVENLSELLTDFYLPHTGRLYAKWTSNGGGSGGSAGTTGWVGVTDAGSKIWYYYKNGEPVTSSWVKSGSSWYWLDAEGVMAANTVIEDGGAFYYLKSGGAMLATAGWYRIATTEMYYDYLFDDEGDIVLDEFGNPMDDYNNGVEYTYYDWVYCTGSGGRLATGWKYISGSWYYFDPETALMVTGTNLCGTENTLYFFNASGRWQYGTGWKVLNTVTTYRYYTDGRYSAYKSYTDTDWFYLKNSAVQTGWQTIGGKTYYFDPPAEDGVCSWTGWMYDLYSVEIDDVTYHFNASGALVKNGWLKYVDAYDGYTEWYYVVDNELVTDQIYAVNGVKYYFDEDGVMVTGGLYGVVYNEETGETDYTNAFVVNASGVVVQNGWCSVTDEWDGQTYWFYVKNGDLVLDDWVDQYYFGNNGIMYSNCVLWEYPEEEEEPGYPAYAFAASGKRILNGWARDSYEDYDEYAGEWYTYTDWYYLENGKFVTEDWRKISGTWYYFDECGYMLAETVQWIDDVLYAFTSGGAWQKSGWADLVYWSEEGPVTEWYYFRNYSAVTGWQKIGGSWYYFDTNDYHMYAAGDTLDYADGLRYTFDASGHYTTEPISAA